MKKAPQRALQTAGNDETKQSEKRVALGKKTREYPSGKIERSKTKKREESAWKHCHWTQRFCGRVKVKESNSVVEWFIIAHS